MGSAKRTTKTSTARSRRAAKPTSSRKQRSAEVLTFTEGSAWVAVWVRFDLVAQGKTEKEACERLVRTIAAQAILDAEAGNLKTFGSCPKPSLALVRRWRKAARATGTRNHVNSDGLLTKSLPGRAKP